MLQPYTARGAPCWQSHTKGRCEDFTLPLKQTDPPHGRREASRTARAFLILGGGVAVCRLSDETPKGRAPLQRQALELHPHRHATAAEGVERRQQGGG